MSDKVWFYCWNSTTKNGQWHRAHLCRCCLVKENKEKLYLSHLLCSWKIVLQDPWIRKTATKLCFCKKHIELHLIGCHLCRNMKRKLSTTDWKQPLTWAEMMSCARQTHGQSPGSFEKIIPNNLCRINKICCSSKFVAINDVRLFNKLWTKNIIDLHLSTNTKAPRDTSRSHLIWMAWKEPSAANIERYVAIIVIRLPSDHSQHPITILYRLFYEIS